MVMVLVMMMVGVDDDDRDYGSNDVDADGGMMTVIDDVQISFKEQLNSEIWYASQWTDLQMVHTMPTSTSTMCLH